MHKRKIFIYSCFIISLISIILGIYLVICSFKHETLDNKYTIEKATNYISKKRTIDKGEFNITKDINYISKGTYRIIFKINHNQEDEDILFTDKSKITITEILGDSYKLETDNIILNTDAIKLYGHNTTTSDYEMNYDNNTFEISFTNNKVFKYNTITLYITLKNRDINKKHITSKESYYSFTPNIKNSFYEKKTMQSYVIDGYGYIVLKKK